MAVMLAALAGASAQPAKVIKAFEGGVRADALLKDPSAIVAISSHCYEALPAAGDHGNAAAKCIDDQLRRAGASAQAIAFADYAPVPAAIAWFKNYRNASVAYAVMRWADGASGWCLIGRSGEALGMWEAGGFDQDVKVAAFARTHPGVTLWMPTGKEDGPKVMETGHGVERFVFPFAVKTCHACALIGMAHVAFDFNRAGRYAGARVLAIEESSPTAAPREKR